MNNKVGQRINTALAMRDKKQKELARAIGVTDNTISYFCGGKRTPNLQQIIAIAKELNVSTDYLLGLSGTPSVDEDVQAACKTTGLSEESVKLLHDMRGRAESLFQIAELNKLLLSPHFFKILNLLFMYRAQCAAAHNRPVMIEQATNAEDISRYKQDLRRAVEDKDLFLFNIQKHLFSLASDIEAEMEGRDNGKR